MQLNSPIEALGQLPPPEPAAVFDLAAGADPAAAARSIGERGFCILRNAFDADLIEAVNGRIAEKLRKPAIAGAPGYFKVDHPKKLLQPFVLGGDALKLLLDERVIGIIEQAMDGECVLAECFVKHDRGVGYTYFPMHSDFSEGWAKSPKAKDGLTRKDLAAVVGVGGALYLHDTGPGAFTYCDATHFLLAPKGPNLAGYTAEERKLILSRRVRCDGKKGDLVLFDDRGFHGPDQPSSEDRLVILLDYYRIDSLGFAQVTPLPIWSSDIGSLSEKQLRVAGAGADYMVAPDEYTHTRFRQNRWYGLLAAGVERAYLWEHLKSNVKRMLGRA